MRSLTRLKMFAPSTSVNMRSTWWINRTSLRISRRDRKTGSLHSWNPKSSIKLDSSRLIRGSRSLKLLAQKTISSIRTLWRNLSSQWSSTRQLLPQLNLLLNPSRCLVDSHQLTQPLTICSSTPITWLRGQQCPNDHHGAVVVLTLAASVAWEEQEVLQPWSVSHTNKEWMGSSVWLISLSARILTNSRWFPTRPRTGLCCRTSTQTIRAIGQHLPNSCKRHSLKLASPNSRTSYSLSVCCSWKRPWIIND